ncbi:pyrroloquinoline quinone precursor peptide PqqA [Telluria sp. B2]
MDDCRLHFAGSTLPIHACVYACPIIPTAFPFAAPKRSIDRCCTDTEQKWLITPVSQCVSIAIPLFNFGTPEQGAIPSFHASDTATAAQARRWHGYCLFRFDWPANRPAHIEMANSIFVRRSTMTWSKPEFIDWRFGFEITLYIANR